MDVRAAYCSLVKEALIEGANRSMGTDMQKYTRDRFAEQWQEYIADKCHLLAEKAQKRITNAKYLVDALHEMRTFLSSFREDIFYGAKVPWKKRLCQDKFLWGTSDLVFFKKTKKSGILTVYMIETTPEPIRLNSLYATVLRTLMIDRMHQTFNIPHNNISIILRHPLAQTERAIRFCAPALKPAGFAVRQVIQSIESEILFPRQEKETCGTCQYRSICNWSLVKKRRSKRSLSIPRDLPGFNNKLEECPI